MGKKILQGRLNAEAVQSALRDKQQGYINLLVGALQRFYQEDADAVFSESPVDERAMVGCVARYVWCDRHRAVFDNLEPDVDIEYNKWHKTEAELHDKEFKKDPIYCTNKRCNQHADCWLVIENQKKERCACPLECKDDNCKKHPKFRPDMIVHKRGSSEGMGNGMIVEFKKVKSSKDAIEKKLSEFAFDLAKIRFCTCEHRNFQYKTGAFVILSPEKAFVTIVKKHDEKSNPIDEFFVTSKGESKIDIQDNGNTAG